MRRHGVRGMTLIELVIVTGILVSLILTMMVTVLSSRTLTRESAERAQARAVAHGKVAELRGILRAAPLDTDHDVQFQAVLDQETSTPTSVVLLQEDTGAQLLGELEIEAFTSTNGVNEALANTRLEAERFLTAGTIDVDGDGNFAEADVPLADLQIVPVLITVRWRPATWEPGDPLASFRLGALIY